jgi:polar amino acid transport system substrate-binding protein
VIAVSGSRGRLSVSAALACAVAATLMVGGCSSSDAQRGQAAPSSSSVAVDRALHEKLPADVLSRGKLIVVTDASYPPIESFDEDGQTVIGVDPDIAKALGALIGVAIEFRNADFGTLIDLVKTGGADMVMSGMTDTPAREKDLDFVNYFAAGTSIEVQRGNPQLITDPKSLCGQPVAVEGDTTQEALVQRYQAKCSEPITVLTGTTNDDALVLLRTGRVVAVLMDYPPAERLTTDPKTHAHYELSTTSQYEPGLYGIGLAKESTQLRDVVSEALDELIRSGKYQEILDDWNVGHGAVAQASINAASGS